MLAPGDAALAGSWTAPANDGGSAITGYKVQWRSGGEDWDPTTRETSTTMTEHRISGLTNGVNYTVRVAAVNALGTGAWSTEAAGMHRAGDAEQAIGHRAQGACVPVAAGT